MDTAILINFFGSAEANGEVSSLCQNQDFLNFGEHSWSYLASISSDMNANHWNYMWTQTTWLWSLSSSFLTREGWSPAIFSLELHSLKFLPSQVSGFTLAPLGDCSSQEAFSAVQLLFSISHFSLQEKSFLNSMTAHWRSLGLRTTPRPPAQRGFRAAGATTEEGDEVLSQRLN